MALAPHVDVLEFGLPYSDPVLDGPVIQEASAAALAAGFRIRDLFDVVDTVSSGSAAALLVMSYWGPISRYGPERFAAGLAAAGGAGLVVPDLPIEEADPWLGAARRHNLATVFVVAPQASDARLARICAAGSGMIYAPAAAGVTGSGKPTGAHLPPLVERLRGLTGLPIAVVSVSRTPPRHGTSADTRTAWSSDPPSSGASARPLTTPGRRGLCRRTRRSRSPLHPAPLNQRRDVAHRSHARRTGRFGPCARRLPADTHRRAGHPWMQRRTQSAGRSPRDHQRRSRTPRRTAAGPETSAARTTSRATSTPCARPCSTSPAPPSRPTRTTTPS